MEKVSFAKMNLKVANKTIPVSIAGAEIQVLDYLPIEDYYDWIMISIQKSMENGVVNPIKLEMYFNLNMIYLLTNISFTEKQREDEAKLFNILDSNGVITAVARASSIYQDAYEICQEQVKKIEEYNRSAAALLQKVIQDLPKNAEMAANIVNNFDKEKYQEAINFAKAVGNKV